MLRIGRARDWSRHALRCFALAAGALILATTASQAQDFPTRPVKIIVPFPAGGSADIIPQVIADWLSRKWGQPVTVENVTGAAGNIGAAVAYRAEPDGYTLLSAPPPPLVINHNLYPNLGFDPTQFKPVIVIAQVPNALLLNPNKVKATTVAEFVRYLRDNPGQATSATQGNGTTSHLTSEMFQISAQVQVRHIPYRGSAPALQGLVAGDVDFMFDNLGVSLPLAQDGKLRLLAVASEKRLPSLPDVPTMAETLPGFQSVAWFAVVAPPKTPEAIVQRLNRDINEALRQPEVQDRLKTLSAVSVGGTVETTAAYLREEIQRWNEVIKTAKVTMQ